jgi:hypothetical protein
MSTPHAEGRLRSADDSGGLEAVVGLGGAMGVVPTTRQKRRMCPARPTETLWPVEGTPLAG